MSGCSRTVAWLSGLAVCAWVAGATALPAQGARRSVEKLAKGSQAARAASEGGLATMTRWVRAQARRLGKLLDQPQGRPVLVDEATADRVLRPGDLLVKFGGKNQTPGQGLIVAGQTLIKAVARGLNRTIRAGTAQGFHDVIYLGQGMVAEASSVAHAVTVRGLRYHAGYLFQVIRPRDGVLAATAARIARTWANGRMKYLVPWYVAAVSKRFGPDAHREALRFGKAAFRAGGPRRYGAMFCSQFAIAAYQAAIVRDQLQRNPRLRAKEIRLPLSLRLHASNSSPMTFHGQIQRSIAKKKGTWSFVGLVVITGKPPPH